MRLESVRKSYARYAPVYDATFGWMLGIGGRIRAAEITNKRPGRILDIGVGTGLTLPYYDRQSRITGIDISPEMLVRGKERISRDALDHVDGLVVMDAERLAFPDNSFDHVVAAYVMSVVPDPNAVMREIERVCRPGGEVVIVNHFTADKGIRLTLEKGLAPLSDMLGWRPDFSLREVLARTSLELVDTESLTPFGLFTLLHLHNPD